jgi:hypothetical protein
VLHEAAFEGDRRGLEEGVQDQGQGPTKQGPARGRRRGGKFAHSTSRAKPGHATVPPFRVRAEFSDEAPCQLWRFRPSAATLTFAGPALEHHFTEHAASLAFMECHRYCMRLAAIPQHVPAAVATDGQKTT